MNNPTHLTAFCGPDIVAKGPTPQVAIALSRLATTATTPPLLVFDDQNGKVVDLDLRGPEVAILERYVSPAQPTQQSEPARGPGRPRLGVVAREVTLLPQHWDWLATQRGGASATLRRLVEDARKASQGADEQRLAEERTYRFLSAMAGDLPGFEEAIRALFAHDHEAFAVRMMDWPADVRTYALGLLGK
jgi:hypothetical protein